MVSATVVIDTTKVDIFKQITTHGGEERRQGEVVIDTTKVDIFKQITTHYSYIYTTASCY